MRNNPLQLTAAALTALLQTCLPVRAATAGITRGYVVSYMIPAIYTVDAREECPNGLNPDGPHLLERVLRAEGKSEAEVKAGIDPDTFDMYKMGQLSTYRGRIEGKPTDIFLHPLSDQEPLQLSKGKYAIGFNLDGSDRPDKLIDPISHETGINNQMSRILGCTDLNRGTPESRAKATTGEGRPGLAWLITVDGADNFQNADHVTIRISRALQDVVRGSQGVQRNMTYTIDASDGRMQNNVWHGHIKEGTFAADEPVDFFMSNGTGYQDLKRSRIRIAFAADGNFLAFLGGFEPITAIYARDSNRRGIGEQEGQSAPAMYQAMLELADTDIDRNAQAGKRTRISTTYQIGAVPAFIRSPDPNRKSTR